MRRLLVLGALALTILGPLVVGAAGPRPVVVTMDADRFDISGEGNSVTGLRRAPVPYSSLEDVAAAVARPEPVPAAVRLVRGEPPQVTDYVFCVTENGALVIGQQIRGLDLSGQYTFINGDIKRAYPALEATVPWTWIVDIPLGREVAISLELRAMTQGWPVRAITVAPRLTR